MTSDLPAMTNRTAQATADMKTEMMEAVTNDRAGTVVPLSARMTTLAAHSSPVAQSVAGSALSVINVRQLPSRLKVQNRIQLDRRKRRPGFRAGSSRAGRMPRSAQPNMHGEAPDYSSSVSPSSDEESGSGGSDWAGSAACSGETASVGCPPRSGSLCTYD